MEAPLTIWSYPLLSTYCFHRVLFLPTYYFFLIKHLGIKHYTKQKRSRPHHCCWKKGWFTSYSARLYLGGKLKPQTIAMFSQLISVISKLKSNQLLSRLIVMNNYSLLLNISFFLKLFIIWHHIHQFNLQQ